MKRTRCPSFSSVKPQHAGSAIVFVQCRNLAKKTVALFGFMIESGFRAKGVSPKGSKYPTLEISTSKNPHLKLALGSDNQTFGPSTLWVLVVVTVIPSNQNKHEIWRLISQGLLI